MNEFKDMLLSKMEVSNLIKIIEASMDDYLYIMDLQEDTYRISAKALERFSVPSSFFGDAHDNCMSFIYQEDRQMVKDQLCYIAEGRIKDQTEDVVARWGL